MKKMMMVVGKMIEKVEKEGGEGQPQPQQVTQALLASR